MRILWFTNTPSNASEEFNYSRPGGGWITSLETLIVGSKKITLAICFFYEGDEFKVIKKESVTYYGVPLKVGNALKRIIVRQFSLFNDENSNYFKQVIDDFKPDIIHIFGTESGYGKILLNRSEKVLFQIQGLLGPISEVFFPPGLDKFTIIKNSSLPLLVRGLSLYHSFKHIQKRVNRESDILKNYKYFTGRTEWDKNYIKYINPDANYYHCDEVLRQEFFENRWSGNISEINDKFIIGSTINAHLFKGLDLIYKVMLLLKDYNIHWKIMGIDQSHEFNKILRKRYKPEKHNLKIEFLGLLDTANLIDHLLTCHLFVHPSYMDNSSNSVCEAMLLGMPVLSSFSGGLKSLLKHTETGYFFNPYDKYDLTGLLLFLINNFDQAIRVGSNARQIAIERHSPEKILDDIEKIYLEISKII